jgi:hypothetical protein
VAHHREDLVVGLAGGERRGRSPLIASVCRKSALRAWPSLRVLSAARLDVAACETISSRKRLAWRALRDTSERPRLWLSSSSSVAIGR